MPQFEYLKLADADSRELNELGRRGWELVATPSGEQFDYIFKRETGDSSRGSDTVIVVLVDKGPHWQTAEKILSAAYKSTYKSTFGPEAEQITAFTKYQASWAFLKVAPPCIVASKHPRVEALALQQKLADLKVILQLA